MKKFNVLDTTLRDGSYTINFSFTASDTAIICKELEKSGVGYIEVGHGAGLHASLSGHGKAAASDEEYMAAARKSLKNAHYGMFCIPGIARIEDLEAAKKHRMDFIRIGTNVDEIEISESFIRKAKKYGMMVAANYMKSYALSPKEFAKKVLLSEKYGADIVYVVDSAGGMFIDEIQEYFSEIRKVSDIPLGFHGHNNLGMAVANSFEAVRMGFSFVDASLQGLGRSSGNAGTEALVGALEKRGYRTGIHFLELLKVGQKYIQPLITRKGESPLDIVAGYSDFHSSYMPKILACADQYHVDPEILIIEACRHSKVDVKKEDLDRIAAKLSKKTGKKYIFMGRYNMDRYVGNEQEK